MNPNNIKLVVVTESEFNALVRGKGLADPKQVQQVIHEPPKLPRCCPVPEHISLDRMRIVRQVFDDADGNVPEAGPEFIESRVGEAAQDWLANPPADADVLAIWPKVDYLPESGKPVYWCEEYQGLFLGKPKSP
ncbi:hypothetical protein HYV84_03550 [Candidatus Woesearchaeota archaeon]|nr:hypothetical protein [Candidatus Woesearchaeota archaeon]